MRRFLPCIGAAGLIFGVVSLSQALGQIASAPAPLTRPDCTKLKGKEKSACEARLKADDAAVQSRPAKDTGDPLAFPEEKSQKGGEMQHGTSDMPTSGVPDPPSDSMKPSDVDSLPGSPMGRSPGSSSSSSSDSGVPVPAEGDDDVAPTSAGRDSPVTSSSLKDLGSHGDTSAGRAKLEQNRVADDLQVGGYYYKEGNLGAALARYRDALQHDPDNPDAHFGLAQVLLKQSKRDEAVTHLQRYVQLAPDDDHTKEAQKLLARLQSPK